MQDVGHAEIFLRLSLLHLYAICMQYKGEYLNQPHKLIL